MARPLKDARRRVLVFPADDNAEVRGRQGRLAQARCPASRTAPEERAALYQHSLDTTASFPDIVRRLLLRLREDAGRFDPATLISLLRAASRTEPDELYIMLVNELWWRLEDSDEKQATIGLMVQLCSTWPHIMRMDLDRHLLVAPGVLGSG